MALSPARSRLAFAALAAVLFLAGCTGAGGQSSERASSSEARPTTTPVPHDARADVCPFAGTSFTDGIVETEDGTSIYVAVTGGGAGMGLSPADGVATADTLCVEATTVSDEISCGTYYTESNLPITVAQTGMRVTTTWHDDDATTATVQTSNMHWSECSEEISYTTGGTFGGSTIESARVQRSKLELEHVTTIANRLEGWSDVARGDATLSEGTCTGLGRMGQIAQAHKALEAELANLGERFDPVPAGMQAKITTYQDAVSAAWDSVEDDSPIGDALFELWFAAYFDWPLIADEVDLDDPDASEDDLLLATMGAPARLGLVLTTESGFATQAETIRMLSDLSTARCEI